MVQQTSLDKKVLDIEDFRVLDVLGDTGLILVAARPERFLEEDLHEDTSLQREAIELDSVCLSELVPEPEESASDRFLHKQTENFPLRLSELCQDRHLSEQSQNTHMSCETDYIFVEQMLLPLKR